MFAIIKTAGTNIGSVKSVHRSFAVAFKKQPASYYGLVNIGDRKVSVGEIRPDLIDLLAAQNSRRARGLAVTGGPNDYF